MRSSILLASAFAAGSLAGPLVKRVYVTDLVEVTVTKYVTLDADSAPTPVVDVQAPAEAVPTTITITTTRRKWGGHRYGSHMPSGIPQVPDPSTLSTVVVTPSPVQQPATEAPAPEAPAPEAPAPPAPEAPAPEAPAPTTVTAAAPASTSQAPATAAAADTTNINAATLAKLTSGPAYQAMVLRHNNLHRANHSCSPLVWDDALAAKALDSAKNAPSFAHTNAAQNLAFQSSDTASGDAKVSASITDGWYNFEMMFYEGLYGQKISDYDWNNLGGEKWGHFTQVVWPAATKIGCATVWRDVKKL